MKRFYIHAIAWDEHAEGEWVAWRDVGPTLDVYNSNPGHSKLAICSEVLRELAGSSYIDECHAERLNELAEWLDRVSENERERKQSTVKPEKKAGEKSDGAAEER